MTCVLLYATRRSSRRRRRITSGLPKNSFAARRGDSYFDVGNKGPQASSLVFHGSCFISTLKYNPAIFCKPSCLSKVSYFNVEIEIHYILQTPKIALDAQGHQSSCRHKYCIFVITNGCQEFLALRTALCLPAQPHET